MNRIIFNNSIIKHDIMITKKDTSEEITLVIQNTKLMSGNISAVDANIEIINVEAITNKQGISLISKNIDTGKYHLNITGPTVLNTPSVSIHAVNCDLNIKALMCSSAVSLTNVVGNLGYMTINGNLTVSKSILTFNKANLFTVTLDDSIFTANNTSVFNAKGITSNNSILYLNKGVYTYTSATKSTIFINNIQIQYYCVYNE